MSVQAEVIEAHPASSAAQLLRPGVGDSHDKTAPVNSFLDDVVRKSKLKQVMGAKQDAEVPMHPLHRQMAKGMGVDPKAFHQGRLAPEQEELPEGEKVTKEDVNYRYSSDPDKRCGVCRYFIDPGACQLVAGLIRTVDVSDLFEPRGEEDMEREIPRVQAEVIEGEGGPGSGPRPGGGTRQRTRVPGPGGVPYDRITNKLTGKSKLVPGERPLSARIGDIVLRSMRRQAEKSEGGPGSGPQPGQQKKRSSYPPYKPAWSKQDMQDYKKAVQQRARQRVAGGLARGFTDMPKETTAARFVKLRQTPQLGEVTPPGYEDIVKALKRKTDIESPWAVAWAMKKKGVKPVQAEVIERKLVGGKWVPTPGEQGAGAAMVADAAKALAQQDVRKASQLDKSAQGLSQKLARLKAEQRQGGQFAGAWDKEIFQTQNLQAKLKQRSSDLKQRAQRMLKGQ